MRELDADGDGAISADEWRAAFVDKAEALQGAGKQPCPNPILNPRPRVVSRHGSGAVDAALG